ncbi:MAG: hypothetical protein MI724_04120, partial [Spirochaetales bacterium]|nr:hypothetical protein [Spirochaetales bacterium]
MVFGLFLLIGVFGSFVYFSSVHIGSTAIIDNQERQLANSQANLDAVLNEVQSVLRTARSFDEELVDTVNSLGIERPDDTVPAAVTRGDLAAFFDIQAVADDRVREIQELRDLSDTLRDAVDPLR